MCFTTELPEEWYPDNTGGASSRECPIAQERFFSFSVCYVELDDPVPTSPPPGREGECCYWVHNFHCR